MSALTSRPVSVWRWSARPTTLCNLIPRFYEVTGGRILIDGQDIQHVTLKSLREDIGIVQQDVYLFSGSVADNIAYGKPGATREEIIEAARLAGAERFISALKDGFDTYVGERGVKLSGGQKQRIAIARVFLKNPPILILDEATSGLDPVVRDEVTDLLLDFARDENHSILISSHIVSDLEKLCDTIAFLHKGRLLLCEEKDALREEYALWHGTAAQLAVLDAQVYGKRVTPYGAEALVRRDALPAGAELAPVSIEELFVLMVKGEDVQ